MKEEGVSSAVVFSGFRYQDTALRQQHIQRAISHEIGGCLDGA